MTVAPFVDDGDVRTRVERVPASRINRELDGWKQLRQDGWDVVVLIEPSGGDVVVLACRAAERLQQPSLLAEGVG